LVDSVSLNSSILNTTDSGATWEVQATFETIGTIAHIAFLDYLRGWIVAVTDDGETNVYQTPDGGITWEPEEFPHVGTVHSISIVPSHAAFMVATDSEGAFVLRYVSDL